MDQFLKELKKYKLYVIVFLALVIAGSAVYGLSRQTAAVSGDKVIIQVKPGMGSSAIAAMLLEQGVINNKLAFQLTAKLQGLENSLQAGEYIITKNMTIQQILKILAKGETAYLQFTIPEGYTINQIALLLQQQNLGNAEKFKALAKTAAPYGYMVNNNPDVAYKAEGYLFPDTYQVSKGVTEEQLLKMMLGEFDQRFNENMRALAAAKGLSIKDVIILASLVEKEAQIPEDRPIIAGVFLNRLKISMPLQSCATIQYILGYPKAELTVQDTEIPSPYNSYQHMGLPPGPIANPGMAAIQAVLTAAPTEYIYFVADKHGAHHFSKTYAEHLQAIERVAQ